jgi:glucan phosphoethanolaminetransferase (alkaline phosphatase superfamily)
MGVFSKLLQKVDVMEVFSTVSKGIDELGLTKEEKVKFEMNKAEKTMEFALNDANNNSIKALTRRYLSLSVFSVFLFLVILCVVVYPFNPEYALFILEVIKVCLITLVMMIGAFFFGGYYMDKYIDKKKKKEAKI